MPAKRVIEFECQHLTYKEIGAIVGLSGDCVRARHNKGLSLRVSKHRVQRPGTRNRPSQRRAKMDNIMNDKARLRDDLVAQRVVEYLRDREVVMSLQEIAELKGCDLEEALLYRDQLTAVLFRGNDPTLELIGEFFGCSRERIRQIIERACEKIGRPSLAKAVARWRDDVEELASIRKPHPFDNVAESGTYSFGSSAVPMSRDRNVGRVGRRA